jgi:hypothetical protein
MKTPSKGSTSWHCQLLSSLKLGDAQSAQESGDEAI